MVMSKYERTTSTPGAESRSGSAKTRRTLDDSILEGDEDVFSDDDSMPSGEKSHSSNKSATNTNNSSGSKPASAVHLSEKQTYVEISSTSHGGDSEDVVMVRYKSPVPGEGTQSERSRPPTGILKKPRDSEPLTEETEPQNAESPAGDSTPENNDTVTPEENNDTITPEENNDTVTPEESNDKAQCASPGQQDKDNVQDSPAQTKDESHFSPASTLSPVTAGSKHSLEQENNGPALASDQKMSASTDHSDPDQMLEKRPESAGQDNASQLESEKLLESEGFAADGFSSEDDSMGNGN